MKRLRCSRKWPRDATSVARCCARPLKCGRGRIVRPRHLSLLITAGRSLYLDPSFLNERSPFFGIALDQFGVRRGARLAVARTLRFHNLQIAQLLLTFRHRALSAPPDATFRAYGKC